MDVLLYEGMCLDLAGAYPDIHAEAILKGAGRKGFLSALFNGILC
jgi:hypothetical protein